MGSRAIFCLGWLAGIAIKVRTHAVSPNPEHLDDLGSDSDGHHGHAWRFMGSYKNGNRSLNMGFATVTLLINLFIITHEPPSG